MRALVVDDVEAVRETIAEALQTRGDEVVTARDGVEAVQTIRQSGPPDVILLDLAMPRMNGAEVIDALSREHLDDVPVIVMTGFPTPPPESRWVVLRKPFGLDDLSAALSAALRLKRATPRRSVSSTDYPGA